MIARVVAAAAALTLIAPVAPASADTANSFVAAAISALDTIPVKGRAPKTGYSREQFGEAWTDDVSVEYGHNGCDTRNDILRRDLVDITVKSAASPCKVLTGVLDDPYTGQTINFQRGKDTSDAVQIDHIVPLSNAWQTGAQLWDEFKRRDFANDPRNLQATNGPTNQAKGDGDVATWLPPNKSYRCAYVARIVNVKAIYGLWVTQPEHDAMARILSNCAG